MKPLLLCLIAVGSIWSQVDSVPPFTRLFSPIVGVWHNDKDGDRAVYAVDGRKWANTLSTGAAERAKLLYGERYAEFLDNVEAYKHFPLAVSQTHKVSERKKVYR